MPQAAERDVLSLHWVEDIWAAHGRRVDQVNNIILSASRNHHHALWISLFAYASILTPACFKISSNAINHWKFLGFFFLKIPVLLNTQSQLQGMLEGLLASSIIVSSGLQIILNCQGDSDYPLISVFRITHFSSYGQAIELKFYLWEKKVLWLAFPRKKQRSYPGKDNKRNRFYIHRKKD